MASEGSKGSLVIFQHRPWVANPRLGAFVAYVDGKKAGVVPVLGRIQLRVPAGSHIVRIRGWQYMSPRVPVTVREGETVTLRADVSKGRRSLMMLFRPWASLVLTPADQVPGLAEVTRKRASMMRVRAHIAAASVVGLIGAVLLLSGLAPGRHALLWIGLGLVVVGQGWGIAAVVRERRRRAAG